MTRLDLLGTALRWLSRRPFLSFLIQASLGNFLPTFVTSSCGNKAPQPRDFLQVIDYFVFSSAQYSVAYSAGVSKEELYRDPVDVVFPELLHRSSYSDGPGHDVFCRVKDMCVPPSVKTFFLLIPCLYVTCRGLDETWGNIRAMIGKLSSL